MELVNSKGGEVLFPTYLSTAALEAKRGLRQAGKTFNAKPSLEFWLLTSCMGHSNCSITTWKDSYNLSSLDHYHILLLLLSHFSRVRLCVTPWTAAFQAPSSMGFSRQEYYTHQKKKTSKWIKDLNVSPETIKLLEENIGGKLADIGWW